LRSIAVTLCAPLLAALLSLPATAQMQLGRSQAFETRFGRIDVVAGEWDNRLRFAGQEFDDLAARRLWILGGFGRAEERHDWVLVRFETGGNACFSVHAVLRVAPGAMSVSAPFGHCVAEVVDLTVLPDRIEVVMTHPDVSIARETFTYDGATLSVETRRLQTDVAAAGPGPDVVRWLGRHPSEIFNDLSERARFARAMPEGRISALADHVSVSTTTERRGDWVLGRGCLPHQCDRARGLWGVRITDGAVGAAFLGPNGAAEVYGLAATDPVLLSAMSEHRP
jgi:hypothetical protein